MALSETVRLSLFLVVRGGIKFHRETWCSKHRSLTGFWILTLEPERLVRASKLHTRVKRDHAHRAIGAQTDAQ